MAFSRSFTLCLRPVAAGLGACVIGLHGLALAQPTQPGRPASASNIFTCIDDRGRKLTSDRPIPECQTKEQRLLNRDGSLKQVRQPPMSADERAEFEAAEARAAQARAAQADAVRRDRNLKARFPNEAAHQRARVAALDTVRVAMRNSESRLIELGAERKPLMEEAEFYRGKTLPARVKQQIEANDAGVAAQREAIANQQAELLRVNKLYDEELARLKLLWAGTGPTVAAAPRPASSRP
ncbi:MAG: hypothetical protein ACKVQR_09405 [Aquabacterium sp.]